MLFELGRFGLKEGNILLGMRSITASNIYTLLVNVLGVNKIYQMVLPVQERMHNHCEI